MYSLDNEFRTKSNLVWPWHRVLAAIIMCSCTMILLATACQLEREQEIPRLGMQSQFVNLPNKDYRFAVWLDDSRLAVTYPISSVNLPGIILEQLAVVDVATGELQLIELTKPDECEGGHLLQLSRIQLNQVGLVLECYSSKPGKSFEEYIVSWDAATGAEAILYHYPPRFRAGDFAFSPDLTEILQERDGDGIHNTLYRVSIQGDLEQLLADYYRVGSPDWSGDGSQVIFAATQHAPDEHESLFTGLVAIDNALSQPWVIYAAKPDLSEQQVLVDNILGVRSTRLSPDDRLLGFNASNYQGQAGVFVVNLSSGEIIQVWEKDTDFDWSPDGKRMVIMISSSQGTFRKPAILDMSELTVGRNEKN